MILSPQPSYRIHIRKFLSDARPGLETMLFSSWVECSKSRCNGKMKKFIVVYSALDREPDTKIHMNILSLMQHPTFLFVFRITEFNCNFVGRFFKVEFLAGSPVTRRTWTVSFRRHFSIFFRYHSFSFALIIVLLLCIGIIISSVVKWSSHICLVHIFVWYTARNVLSNWIVQLSFLFTEDEAQRN